MIIVQPSLVSYPEFENAPDTRLPIGKKWASDFRSFRNKKNQNNLKGVTLRGYPKIR
jgi:hypothetical protein